ncbi:MAG: DUF2878 family protein [Deltaproteobacteria bacterium]|nr:DUF2878 family protein [Deltaproteobacteria bacterium]
MTGRRRANLLNLLALQLGAAGPLLLAALGQRAIGIGLAWAAVGLALLLSRARAADLRLLFLGAVLGTAGETALALAGLMQFTHPIPTLPFPGWLTPSWGLLGMATAYVLAPLRGRAGVAAVVGVLVGAAGLYGAVAAQEIDVAGTWQGMTVSVGLGALVAILAMLAPRLDTEARD